MGAGSRTAAAAAAVQRTWSVWTGGQGRGKTSLRQRSFVVDVVRTYLLLNASSCPLLIMSSAATQSTYHFCMFTSIKRDRSPRFVCLSPIFSLVGQLIFGSDASEDIALLFRYVCAALSPRVMCLVVSYQESADVSGAGATLTTYNVRRVLVFTHSVKNTTTALSFFFGGRPQS